MNRVVAGRWEPYPGHVALADGALAGAAGEPGAATEIRLGPLALAFTGPAPSASGRLWCLLDGHVYNLEDVALQSGVPAGTPAEAALALAFERTGEPLLRRLRGDFALYLWDRAAERGWLVRDQLGGRGLHLARRGDGVLFASEVRNLLPLLRHRPGPDRFALAHWLNLSCPPADRTLFEGVSRLPAAHLVELGPGARPPRRYWEPRYERPLRAAREDLVEEIRAAITRAVERRLRPGEPASVLLSGGLDSGAVASTAMRLVGADRRPAAGYSAVFPEHPSIDESPQIDRLTSELGLPSVRIAVRGGSVLAGTVEYLRAWDVPASSPNVFFWGPLLRRAREDGVRTMLDGEGGDEVFGLSPYLLADRLRRGRLASALRLARRVPFYGSAPSWRAAWRLTRLYGVEGATPLALQRVKRRFRDPATYAHPFLTPAMARAHLESDHGPGWKALPGPRWWAWLAASIAGGAPVAQAYDHIRRRGAMAGIEPRHPLVDVDLVELMLRVPPELAWDPRHSRPLLRESMDGVMPDAVRLRPEKSLFDALFHQSLTGPDLPAIRELLGAPDAELHAFLRPDILHAGLLAGPPRAEPQRREWATACLALANVECWLRQGRDPAFADALLERHRLPAPSYRLTTLAA